MSIVITIRKLCKPHDDGCDNDDNPPPPPDHPLSPIKVLLICTLAATFAFLCYIILIKTCRAFQTSSRTPNVNQTETRETHQDTINEDHDHEPVVFHPIWLINTIGLDQSVIDSIQMFKYRKEDGLIDSDCPVCLGVFEEDESLRILPKCSHVFHVACIDTWLRSHKNCPVCRAPVVTINQNLIESNTHEEIPSNGPENRTTGVGNSREIDTNGVRVQSDLTNHCCQKLEQVRRSVSMGSFRFSDQELVVSQKPNVGQKSGKRRGSNSSTVEEGRVLSSGQDSVSPSL